MADSLCHRNLFSCKDNTPNVSNPSNNSFDVQFKYGVRVTVTVTVSTYMTLVIPSTVCMYVCVYVWSSHIARVRINQVKLPILLVVS